MQLPQSSHLSNTYYFLAYNLYGISVATRFLNDVTSRGGVKISWKMRVTAIRLDLPRKSSDCAAVAQRLTETGSSSTIHCHHIINLIALYFTVCKKSIIIMFPLFYLFIRKYYLGIDVSP